MSRLIAELRAEWKELDAKIEAQNGEFVEMARSDVSMRRLTSIPGVGVLNATALVAAIGDGSGFAKARDLGAWLGLVPRQHTTGGKPRLLGISKRGNTYLRTLLIHGARAALPSLSQSDTPLGRWLKAMDLIHQSLSRSLSPAVGQGFADICRGDSLRNSGRKYVNKCQQSLMR